jgi:transposase
LCKKLIKVYLEGIFFMGEIRKTYDIEFKRKAVAMFLEEGLGYKTVAKALGIDDRMVRRWVAHYEREGIEGLKEKRGTSTGSKNGRPKKAKTLEEEVLRLRAENALLKKLWELQRGQEQSDVKPTKPSKR